MAAKKPIAVVIGRTSEQISFLIVLIIIIGVGPGLGASLAKRYTYISSV